jgi:hypothetical protein
MLPRGLHVQYWRAPDIARAKNKQRDVTPVSRQLVQSTNASSRFSSTAFINLASEKKPQALVVSLRE